jgi:multidrug efflux pump
MERGLGPIIAIGAGAGRGVRADLAFLGGVTGQFYRQFAVTIAISVLISAFNSLTLSPALAAVLLQPHGAPQGPASRADRSGFGWLFRPFNRASSAPAIAMPDAWRRSARSRALMRHRLRGDADRR